MANGRRGLFGKIIRDPQKFGMQQKMRYIRMLTELGHDAIKYAYKHSYMSKVSPITGNMVWQNRSGNLHDSYGSAVYFNGNLLTDTIRYVDEMTLGGKTTDSKSGLSGRESLLEYFNKIHPKKGQNTASLIVVAAMYYAKYLEDGSFTSRSELHYKIRVISKARDFIDRNYSKYIKDFYKRWDLDKPKVKVIQGDEQVRNN